MNEIKVVLRQDDDCHWYMIPASEAADFDIASEKLEGKEYMDCPDDFDDFMVVWDNFRTGGAPDLVPDYYSENGLKPVL